MDYYIEKLWRRGVYAFQKQRERMAGGNSRDESVEAVSELWTETYSTQVGFIGDSTVILNTV